LGLVGAGILYWRTAGLGLRTRLWAGWVTGLGCYGLGLLWARTFNWYGAVVLILVEALFMALAAGFTPPHRGRAPAFVAACTLAEAIRMTWPFGGLPMGGVFLGQADGPLLQLARLGGPLLLTASVWLGGVGVATLVVGLRQGDHRLRVRGLGALVGLSVLVALGAVAPDGGAPVGTRTVVAVQGGGRRAVDKEEVAPVTVFRAQVAATRALPRAGTAPPDVVLWPEDVVSLNGPLAGSSEGATISRIAAGLHTTLIAGVTVPVPHNRFLNEIVVWSPRGFVVGKFEKVHRVPFGEYVPYRSFFSHFANLSEVAADAVPGHADGLLRTPAGPLGTLVSFEVFYASRSRQSVRAGAELLIVPTNTSSYTTAQVPTQEVAADAIQAVETGRNLVQAAPTGYSTVVDQRGNVEQRSVLGRRQALTAVVPLRRGFTVYDHVGDLPTLLLGFLGLLAGWRRERRRALYS
jgi:apolipoprotein N-acyltransferase